MTKPPKPTLLSIADIAETYRLGAATVRTYNGQAAQRRRTGSSRPHDFPAPAARIGNSPLFDADAVSDWFINRPGHGTGGGRPRKPRGSTDMAKSTKHRTMC